jgi:hypothetical protein
MGLRFVGYGQRFTVDHLCELGLARVIGFRV